jgi:hypothetical protein
MIRSNEKGAALLITLILVLVLSVMTASMMFLAQSETWSSLNYRLMTQGRYGAEAGLHAAANYLINPSTGYPGIGASDPIGAYTITGSPVTYGGSAVVLSSLSGVTANHPVSSVKTNFASASTGNLTAGTSTVTYTASAQLLSMRQVLQCGNTQPLTAQLWKITSHGDISGVRNAEVEVSTLLESHLVSCYQYAAFATGNGCGSINFTGNGTVDSYDSNNVAAGQQAYDGNLGSNGNLNTAHNTTINGTFSSPDTGVGACGSGGGVDALSGYATAVTGCETSTTGCGAPLVKLPQTVTYLPPSIPTSAPPPATTISGTASLTPCSGTCPDYGAGNGNYGNITLAGNDVLTLNPYVNPVTHVCSGGTYYVNSITESGNGTVTIAPCPPTSTTPGAYQPVIVDIVGQGNSSPLSLSGNGLTNPSMNPAMIQMQYAGTGTITLVGNGTSAGVVYAPKAAVTMNGNGAWWGSLIGNTVTSTGNGNINYDRRLQTSLMTVGNWTMDTFTWSKY